MKAGMRRRRCFRTGISVKASPVATGASKASTNTSMGQRGRADQGPALSTKCRSRGLVHLNRTTARARGTEL